LADVKGFLVTHRNAGPSTGMVHLVRSEAHAAGLNAGLRLNAEQEFVSYQASLRLKSGSRPEILTPGLTEQTANALVCDLAEAVAARSKSA
jgi:hypothetical protein